jgi:hypothetical protein
LTAPEIGGRPETGSRGEGRGGWFARGLLFESCSCQIVCPGHIHFDQLCTHERCEAWWAIRFDDGELDGVRLGGVKAVIAADSPQRMIDGGWVQTMIIDDEASPEQRRCAERILRGEVGGPWQVLARFVGEHLETRIARIRIEDEPMTKRISVAGLLRGVVTAIRGEDRDQPVRFENIFNQIHAPVQVIARGDSEYDDGVISFRNEGTHGLWSGFHWSVEEG